jgi:hypothetical protein
MSKEQWKNFAKISQDAEGNWALNVLGRKLFVRAYGGKMKGDTDEAVIVIGNRRALDDYDEGTIEAEFVFPQGGDLLTAHVLEAPQPPQWYTDIKARYSGNDPDGKPNIGSLLEKVADDVNKRRAGFDDLEDSGRSTEVITNMLNTEIQIARADGRYYIVEMIGDEGHHNVLGDFDAGMMKQLAGFCYEQQAADFEDFRMWQQGRLKPKTEPLDDVEDL